MKTVYLHGRLGKRFGKKWKLAVDNVQEAFSAIEVNSEGFFDYIIKSEADGNEYIVLSKNPKFIKDENDLRENIIDEKLSKVNSKQTEIHILSPASGSTVIMPILFVSGTIGSGLTTAGYIIASLAISYAVAALTKTPDEQKAKDPTSTKSYLISGGLTRQAQGIAVPLGYGRLKIGPANVATRKKSKKFLGYNPGKGSLLESYSELEFVDLICEGPIHGFVNQYGVTLKDYDILEGIYLKDTPVRISAPLEGGVGDYNFILNEDQDKPRGRPVAKMGEDSDSKILSEGVFT